MKLETLSSKTIMNKLDFAVIMQWNFWKKKRLVVACKQINRKIPNPCNAKEHYQSFIRKYPQNQ